MNTVKKHLATLALLATAWPLAAQTAPAAVPVATPAKDEVVVLSPFQVGASEDVGRYTSMQATSAGRVRVNIMDASQSVSVITSELIDDVGAGRLMDAVKYISGISESTLGSNANERTNVRGFQADGHTVDGFTYGGFMNLDPAIVDRIEVVKGPNSILAPQPTSPGGTVNNATKRPQFRDFGSVRLQVGEFDANSGYFDVNRVASDKVAVRMIGSMRHWDNYWGNAYVHSTTLMPGVTYKFSDRAQVTFQYIYTNWKSSLYLGVPIDPTSGTTTKARILDGIPRDLDVYGEDIYRTDKQHDFKVEATVELLPGLSARFAALYHKGSQYAPQLNTGNSTSNNTGGNRDPLTGNWNYGLQYLQVAPYTASPLTPMPTRIFQRSGSDPRDDPRTLVIQNDYAYIVENDTLKSTTQLGFAYSGSRNYYNWASNITADNFDIDHYVDAPWRSTSLAFYNQTSNRFLQGYLRQEFKFFNDRLIVNAAQSKQYYRQRVHNMVNSVVRTSSPDTSLPSYGVVVKPFKNLVSVYYTYSEQSSALNPSTTGAFVPVLQSSKQKEFGGRVNLLDNKLYATVAHFDIQQDNYGVPNPANLTTPPPNPRLPDLFSDRKAKGWEYELRLNPNKNISLIANYTAFKNRDPNNVGFRGTAEKSGGFLASYSFDKDSVPALDGFRVAVGVDYIGRRAGDAASGVTAASTPTNIIPNQPTFYLDPRTLVNVILAYKSKHNWDVQLNIDNALDKEYMMAAISRTSVYVGTPRNFRASFTYKF